MIIRSSPFSAALVLLLTFATYAPAQANTKTVTLLYTNDFHAAVKPATATWLVDQPQIGGVLNLSGWIEMMRREQPNVFLFDSGDVFTGQAISTLSRGRALIDIFRALRYDATCYGNHEFDYGVDAAKAYGDSEPFPVLAANLFYKGTERPFARPYSIIARNGIKIAVIGVFGPTGASATTLATWDKLEVRDPLPILRTLVPKLRTQADLVVVVAHQGETGPMQSDAEAHPEVQRGFQTDKEMIDALPGLDVLIGGHAHRGIEVPWRSEKTGGIVVQTYGRGTTLGFLQLEIDVGSHKVLRHSGSLIRVAPGVFPPNPQVVAVVRKWEQQIDTEGKEVVGRANTPLNRDYNAESMLGDVIADAMLWKTKADIAFENAGGIRADLPQGAITRYDAVSVLPFVNTAVEMRLNGEQVRQVIEQALTLKTGMAQMAGLHVKYDISQPEYSRAISITVNGAELDAKREYNVVASSFIAGGGDHYAAFLLGKDIHDTGILLDDILTEYLKAKSPIESPTQDRLVPQSSAVRTAH